MGKLLQLERLPTVPHCRVPVVACQSYCVKASGVIGPGLSFEARDGPGYAGTGGTTVQTLSIRYFNSCCYKASSIIPVDARGHASKFSHLLPGAQIALLPLEITGLSLKAYDPIADCKLRTALPPDVKGNILPFHPAAVMLTLTAKAVARRTATSYLTGSSSLTTRFSALAIRPIAVRSFSVYRSPLLAATRRPTTAKKTTTATTKKATTKTAAKKAASEKPKKKAAKKPAAKKPVAKKKVVRKKKELTPEEAEKADIKKWKKQALWNQEPAAGNGSGWAIYVGEQFTGQKLDDGANITDKMRDLRDKWNALSDYDKERYKSQAEVEAVQRKKQRKEWIESHSIEEIHLANQARLLLQRKYNKKAPRLHDERKAKRPTSAFVRFFVSYFNSLDPGAPKAEPRNRFEGASARWKAMSDEEKAPYVKEYQEEMKRFQEENAGFQDRIDELRKSASAK
ncbi:unnamed protein product [Clonostachys byssicola]|uniref:HMG box domain-containing protein n=1 Tax=Clonostachys byssicola TaxID=160290 RepID=A0A9N9UVZ8_9HYPO|nr:unnamed protein product [Clonostachys byssicola]